jgi:hypothetical protein
MLITERFNLEKLRVVEDKEQYYVKITHRFAAVEDLDSDNDVDIIRVWESIRI